MPAVQEERRRMEDDDRKCFLTLKGQMLYLREWESICFLGIPMYVRACVYVHKCVQYVRLASTVQHGHLHQRLCHARQQSRSRARRHPTGDRIEVST